MNQTNRNMLEGPLFPNIIRFTIPIILTSVLQLLFNAADLVVVGQFCGSVSVAAVGATGSITGLLVNFLHRPVRRRGRGRRPRPWRPGK